LREVVTLDARLRADTVACIKAARAVLQSQITPAPTTYVKRCKACSLFNECAPAVVRKDRSARYVSTLFEVSYLGGDTNVDANNHVGSST
jgi:CRISPR-associated exonuclease Cas4